MIKICALNEESGEETRPEEEATKEALEQIALKQYSRALELHRNGHVADATLLLKDLTETEILDGVKKPAPGEKVTTPLYNLKYLCYKNLGVMFGAAGELARGIDAYFAAAELDDSDVSLWHQLGVLCVRACRYDDALAAFLRGVLLRPQHWPCLDRLLTLLLGLHCLEECLELCYQTLTLDPGYLRALVYRRYIFQTYPYIHEYMEGVWPKYKCDAETEETDYEDGLKLIAEGLRIRENHLKKTEAEMLKHSLPELQMIVSEPTWLSLGTALVEMHHFMTENCFSHASRILISYDHKEMTEEPMEVCQPHDTARQQDTAPEDQNKCDTNVADADNNEGSDKDTTANKASPEKADGEAEAPCEDPSTATDTRKKPPTRRRGSAVGLLQQWEWYYKRQPRRKQAAAAARPDRFDHTVYHMLRSILPTSLMQPESTTPATTTDVVSLLEQHTPTHSAYFNSAKEYGDVKTFTHQYTQHKQKHDIIDILKDFLYTLAKMWKLKWPPGLPAVFLDAKSCFSLHVDMPQRCTVDDYMVELHQYTVVTLIAEELAVNAKLLDPSKQEYPHDTTAIDSLDSTLEFYTQSFDEKNEKDLETYVRYLWVRTHINIFNKDEKMASESLVVLLDVVDRCSYELEICNFTFKPIVNLKEIDTYINQLERNERLATVLDLYHDGYYDDAFAILKKSFAYCKQMSRKEEDEISLDFAIQLEVIVDCCWQNRLYEKCFKWTLICLHEALKHYFRHTSGSPDYDKWSRTVVKILMFMEQFVTTHNLLYLEVVSQSELSQGVEDLIRIIGHQVEANGTEMPLGTVSPWIILHYILQREEDQGRGRVVEQPSDEVPDPLMILFLGHEQIGERGWCGQSDAKLIYFIMDCVVSRLRAPALDRCREQVAQHLEQCVYCLYGHPGRKNKVKYLAEHNVSPRTMDWARAQQVYEIFRPQQLPALEGKSGITADTEQLLHRILELLPSACNPEQYVPNVDKYIRGADMKLPTFTVSLPYKMRDIYFLLGDYYFKKEEHKLAIKYNTLDVILNKDRLESWAEISLAKAVNLQRLLNSCKNINNEKEFLNPAKSIIRCFKRTLQLDPTHCNMLIEYGMFVYAVHSFCSRVLKQASESLSMDDFDSLERQKEDMLNTTHKCFKTVLKDMQSTQDSDNEDAWLHFYMLGKVAEKRNRPPSEYLNYYMKGVRSLHEAKASYPQKINYCSPANQSIQVLELHYRIHATILKYIEQHENKPIPSSVGKVFTACIDEWRNGPFVNKKVKKQPSSEQESDSKSDPAIQAANIQKRSISDTSDADQPAVKRMNTEAAKIKRSVSYNPEHAVKTTGEHDKAQGRKKSDSTSSSSSSSSGSSSSSSSSSSASSCAADPPLSPEQRAAIAAACLDALEDCAARFPPHYKALYRLAHYHFYYSKGKDIERCRDLMLSSFKSRSGQKLSGLFGERKPSNFFNNIWKIPVEEVDRAGSFAFHMSRCVLLSMEILKEIDDHKTLLDLSLHLQRIPQADKKYLRDSDREELAQQALSLCIQSLKGQLLKFSQQGDLRCNEVEKNVFDTMMLDIYRYYQRTQKQPSAKQFTNLLVDAYKLIRPTPFTESANLVDLSMKYCQALIQTLKQQAAQASRERTQNAQRKQTATATKRKVSPPSVVKASQPSFVKASQPSVGKVSQPSAVKASQTSKVVSMPPPASKASSRPSATHQPQRSNSEFKTPPLPVRAPPSPAALTAALQNYLPMLNAAGPSALSYLSNMNALHGYTQQLTDSLQNKRQNSFEAEFYRQLLTQSLSTFNIPPPPAKKQKRGPNPKKVTPVVASGSKLEAPPAPPNAPAPSMGTVLSTLPPSMNKLSYASDERPSTSTAAHSPRAQEKTLQEKLAERQKTSQTVASATTSSLKAVRRKKLTDTRKSLPYSNPNRSNPTTSDEIIVLDDD